jgi:hypothetical protein
MLGLAEARASIKSLGSLNVGFRSASCVPKIDECPRVEGRGRRPPTGATANSMLIWRFDKVTTGLPSEDYDCAPAALRNGK